MKTSVIVFFCLLGIMALVEFSSAQDDYPYRHCDSWDCSTECYERGLHGECDSYDTCRCSYCIYSACRRHCLRQNLIGQCDETKCDCLS